MSQVSQPLPIGRDQSQSKDPLLQNSSVKPIETLSSPERTSVRTRERPPADVPPPPVVDRSRRENIKENARADEKEDRRADENIDDLRQRKARIERDRDKQQLLQDQRAIEELSSRDREVRAHEQAHAAVGGQFAGAPSYEFERGPDGVSYAVGGEVSIDSGRASTPEATLLKAQTVRRSALAPANPSPQDRSVAARATRLESAARSEILAIRSFKAEQARESKVAEAKAAEDPSGLADEDEDKKVEEDGPTGLNLEENGSNSKASISNLASAKSVSQILAVANSEKANRPGAFVSQEV